MQRDRFVVADRWLRGADADLELAHVVLDRFAARAAFHAQQASEMALTAVLVAATDDHPTTHSTSALVHELRNVPIDVPNDVAAAASSLDLYYLTSRFPDAIGDADPLEVVRAEDASVAIARARSVIAFARERVVGLRGDGLT